MMLEGHPWLRRGTERGAMRLSVLSHTADWAAAREAWVAEDGDKSLNQDVRMLSLDHCLGAAGEVRSQGRASVGAQARHVPPLHHLARHAARCAATAPRQAVKGQRALVPAAADGVDVRVYDITAVKPPLEPFRLPFPLGDVPNKS